jgi:hypothetical protein
VKIGRLNAADQKIADQTTAEIAFLLRTRPDLTLTQIAKMMDASISKVQFVNRSLGPNRLARKGGRRPWKKTVIAVTPDLAQTEIR